MIVIEGDNVNTLYPQAIGLLEKFGKYRESRNGPTIEIPEPVSVNYRYPKERLLFNPTRDSNPFLGFFEGLHILAGRDDVKFLSDIVANMANYSDDGKVFHGAYGNRLRNAEGGDQLRGAIDRLRANKEDRRVVMTIRRSDDMWYAGKDTPCNLMVDLKIRDNELQMTVFNRSNDTIWGMMGTNVVQFSMLQEYIAAAVGVDVGSYHQVTTSMHVYLSPQWEACREDRIFPDPYLQGNSYLPYPMLTESEYLLGTWAQDLGRFFECVDAGKTPGDMTTPYFKGVVVPMWKTLQAWKSYKANRLPRNFTLVSDCCRTIQATDYRLAVKQWLDRREGAVC